MRLIIISIISSFIINYPILVAGCDKPVTYIKEGELAPCTGYLFTPEKEQEVRIKIEENKFLNEKIGLLEKRIDLYKLNIEYLNEIVEKETKKTELWKNLAEQSTEKYLKYEERTAYKDWIFFAVGVLTTIAASYTLHQISK